MKKLIALFLGLVFSLATIDQVQGALTQQNIIQLLQLKTPEQEVIDQIKAGGTTFTLGAEDVARLKRAGATPAILAAMQGKSAQAIDLVAAEITDLCLVVDYSGSMNEKTQEGIPKIVAAKQAVAKLIDNLPADLNVAVVVYGTDKARGCEDIDLIQPLGKVDKPGLKSQLMSLKNTGMTPIAASLEIAGLSLKKATGGRAIVLVTDGLESCKGDPSRVAAKLAADSGVKFVGLHVVGFDIKAEERASLESIAKAGKGSYFNAANAAELTSAMQKVTQQVAFEPKQRETRQAEFAGKAVKPGAFFHDAPTVEPGEYKGQLAMMQAHYYKIPVRKGQELRAIGIVQKTPYKGGTLDTNNQVFRITIYQEDLSVAGKQNLVIKGNPTTPGTFKNSWTATSDGLAYVAISASDNLDVKPDGEGGTPFSMGQTENPAPSPYTLRLRVEGEGVAATPSPLPAVATKPGTGFEQAAEIPVPVLASTDLKVGEVIYYRARVQKGDTLQVSAAFRKPWYLAANNMIEATYALTVYDEDQVQVIQEKKKVTKNPPDAQSIVLSWPVAMSGNVYVSIGCENSGWSFAPNNFQPKPGEVCLRLTGASAAAGEQSPAGKSKDPFSGAEGTSQ